MTEFRWLPDARKSRQRVDVRDPYPPAGFVRCTDDLLVTDLAPGQWTISSAGLLMLRTKRGEYIERETGGLQ